MKRGGSKMGYTEQFNLLSPCYKEGEQRASDFRIGGAKAKPTKKGNSTKKGKTAKPKKTKTKSKQRGGSSCGASPSVAEMGIVNTPASLEPTESERAWDNRMKGGQGNSTNNKINNISTYLNKLNGVVFDGNTQNGFAIVVERTTKDPSNSKNDKYSIKVIEKLNNIPTMSVLSDQTYSVISQTVRDTSSKVFPLKKTNNKQPVSMNYSIPNPTNTAALSANTVAVLPENPAAAVSGNTVAAVSETITTGGGRKRNK